MIHRHLPNLHHRHRNLSGNAGPSSYRRPVRRVSKAACHEATDRGSGNRRVSGRRPWAVAGRRRAGNVRARPRRQCLRLRTQSMVPRRFFVHRSRRTVSRCPVGYERLPYLVQRGRGSGQHRRGSAQPLQHLGGTRSSTAGATSELRASRLDTPVPADLLSITRRKQAGAILEQGIQPIDQIWLVVRHLDHRSDVAMSTSDFSV